jgi:spore maturation protein CgeB
MNYVFFGLSIASSWGNGHATTFRGLVRELAARGHEVTFYERRTEWYDANCDLPRADYCDIRRYEAWPPPDAAAAVAEADVVVLGSYAVDGIAIADWLPGATRALLLYYDIDTPVTLEQLRGAGRTEYLRADQLARFDAVLSFGGGPVLDELRSFGARRVEPFYCAVDAELYRPVPPDARFRCDLGYMGTYSDARQDMVDELFLAPARLCPERRFALAGPQYPPETALPANVAHFSHVSPPQHAAFHASCAWQVKATRRQMRRIGWSPSVTLFEAAACGAPLISDSWPGFEEFFVPGREALVASTRDDVLAAFDVPDAERRRIGEAARRRILADHTYVQRVDQLEAVLASLGVRGVRGGGGAGATGATGRSRGRDLKEPAVA